MLKELNKIRLSLKSNKLSASYTPLWDAFYVNEQNRKFKNKWDKIKEANS